MKHCRGTGESAHTKKKNRVCCQKYTPPAGNPLFSLFGVVTTMDELLLHRAPATPKKPRPAVWIFSTALFFFWFPPPAHFNPCFRLRIFLVCCFVHCASSLVGFIWVFWGFRQDLRFGFFFHSHYGRFSFLRAFALLQSGPIYTHQKCAHPSLQHTVLGSYGP